MSARFELDRHGWWRALAVGCSVMFTVLACEENLNAPGNCPEFCPISEIQVRDTLLLSNVERDSTYRGYISAHRGLRMQIASPDAPIESRGLIKFNRFPATISLTNTETRDIAQIDSFAVDLLLQTRNLIVSDLEVVVYRMPVAIDSTITFGDTDPFFMDSALVGVRALADSVSPDTLRVILSASAFPTLEPDSFFSAVGVSVRGSAPTFITAGTADALAPARITRFVQVDSANGELVPRSDTRTASFDTFVHSPVQAPVGDVLAIGGTPAARSLLRITVPEEILESAEIVGASLFLVPVGPVQGAPQDTFRVEANALSADFGPKSPLVVFAGLDSASLLPGTLVDVGRTDPIEIDITRIVRRWQSDSASPRSLAVKLTTVHEGALLGELFVGSSRTPGAEPWLRLVYVPPFEFVNR